MFFHAICVTWDYTHTHSKPGNTQISDLRRVKKTSLFVVRDKMASIFDEKDDALWEGQRQSLLEILEDRNRTLNKVSAYVFSFVLNNFKLLYLILSPPTAAVPTFSNSVF